MAYMNIYFLVVFMTVAHAELLVDGTKTFDSNKPDNYDQTAADQEFKRIAEKMNYTNTDEYEGVPDDCLNRDEDNCACETRVIMPYKVLSNNTIRAVVQASYYPQKYRITECKRRNGEETNETCFRSLKVSGRCETRYASVAIYVYDNNKNKNVKSIERVRFNLPVSCVCAITP